MRSNICSIISLSLGIAAILAILITIASLQSPKAVVLDSSHKIFVNDNISNREIIKHSFQVLNIGFKPLRILSVKSSCGCTIANYPEVINPWRTGKIECKMVFGTSDVVRAVELICETNEKQIPIHRFELKAIAANHHSVTPSQLDLGTHFQGDRCKGEFSIMIPKTGYVQNIYDTENAFRYQTSYQKTTDQDIASSVALINVRMELINDSPGDFQSNISILLENGNRLSLPVRWTVAPARGFSLNEVCFGVLRKNSISNATVRFRDSIDSENIAHIKVRSEANWCSVKQVQVERDNIVRIDLTAKNIHSENGRLRGSLIVECNDGKCFRLPFSAIGM